MTVVALVHDYLTQRRGAERVVAAMARAFSDAPIYTSLYSPETTWDDFRDRDIRCSSLNRLGLARRHHRLALPFYGPLFSRMNVEADVAICSSSGWAHGALVRGRKIVYCYTPARWLYQTDRYLEDGDLLGRGAVKLLGPWLRRWDRAAAGTAHRYLAISTAVAERVRSAYGIEAEVLYPPRVRWEDGSETPIARLEPGFLLCVGRRRPYKNLEAVVEAFGWLSEARLVVVGSAPDRERVEPANVTFLDEVSEAELRWLLRHCAGVVTASYEDFGLVPIEAAAFGKPTAALRFGGHLDTVIEGRTGVFFSDPIPMSIAAAVGKLLTTKWDGGTLRSHADRFSEDRFSTRLREIVAEEMSRV